MNREFKEQAFYKIAPCLDTGKVGSSVFDAPKSGKSMEITIPPDGSSPNASNIKVAIRVRPLMDRELANGQENGWSIDNNAIYLNSRNSTSSTFSFGIDYSDLVFYFN